MPSFTANSSLDIYYFAKLSNWVITCLHSDFYRTCQLIKARCRFMLHHGLTIIIDYCVWIYILTVYICIGRCVCLTMKVQCWFVCVWLRRFNADLFTTYPSYSIAHKIYWEFSCALLNCVFTEFRNSYVSFAHIFQSCFISTGTII